MNTNLLIALLNLVEHPVQELVHPKSAANRANAVGDALESYVKDLFCNSFNETDFEKKNEIYGKYFSYIGNQNNPPDVMLKQGDAIEVKKIESLTSGIALNSSYPKDILRSDSPMITAACRDCEEWQEKDILYVIGATKENSLRSLWFVYGNCYAADEETYDRIRSKISIGINELQDVEFSNTNELGRVNSVDPLGITYLRIRGMWGIENPAKVFDYVAPQDRAVSFSVNAIMLTEKYLTFPEEDRVRIESLTNNKFQIKDVKIKSPNNPAITLDAKLLSYVEYV